MTAVAHREGGTDEPPLKLVNRLHQSRSPYVREIPLAK